MEECIITQAILGYGIVQIVAFVGNPVIIKFLRTEYQYRFIAVFVILDNREGCKCLTQSYAIGKDTAIVLLQLVDDGKASILLKVVEFVPYLALLEACCLVGKSSSERSSKNSRKMLYSVTK